MSRKVDLTGQKFGHLMVIGDSGMRRNDGSVLWDCVCDCGTLCQKTGEALANVSTPHCGCRKAEYSKRSRSHDLTGRRFGHLTVLSDSRKKRRGYIVWDCLCDCGASHEAITSHLTRGATKSCGCLANAPRGSDLTGLKVGRLTVERRLHPGDTWECVCECGSVKPVAGTALRRGTTSSCGCLQRDKARTAHTTHGMSRTPPADMLAAARQRAKRDGLPCTITLDDIHIPEVCPALGIALERRTKKHPGSPTLDRLRPHLGYVPGNVAVISNLANTIKQNATSAEVRAVGEWMKAHGL